MYQPQPAPRLCCSFCLIPAKTNRLKADPGNIVKLDKLKQLIGNDEEVLERYVGTFIQQNSEDIGRLRDQLEKKDWSFLKGIAHRMRSGFQLLELTAADDICRELEENSMNQAFHQHIPELIDQLDGIFQQIIQQLENNRTPKD